MTKIGPKDRVLFTDAEWKLLQSSSPSRLKSLKKARLRIQLRRARRLAAKFRDLARSRQRSNKIELRDGKSHSLASRRTVRKSHLAAEASRRFEKRLAQLDEQPAGRMQAQKPKQTRRKGRGTRTQQETVRRTNQRLRAIGRRSPSQKTARRFQQKGTKAIQGHIRARGQRHQARRDSK